MPINVVHNLEDSIKIQNNNNINKNKNKKNMIEKFTAN